MKKQRNPILLGQVSRIVQLLGRYKESESIKHNATKGSLREAYIREFLADLVPPQLGIQSGFVTDSRGEYISPQIDLLIYDRSAIPSFALSEFVTILPIEAVLISIEVKSSLQSKHLKQIKFQQDTIKDMRYSWTTLDRKYLHTAKCTGITQYIIAFDTDCSQENLLSWFEQESALSLVCIIEKYSILRDPNTGKTEIIEHDKNYSEIMQLISRLLIDLKASQQALKVQEREIHKVSHKFYPDIGSYLSFDVPEH